ncbi:MAG TPA: Gfo/Idh/MocA family oxidoreductase [Gaiellaceae bacterium]|jgi:predicted dehydrogenase|nr:Gfo/Idh/MocA family oxidoreductase [Gaiellaceae bacterium]
MRVALVGTGFWGTHLAAAIGRSSLELAGCWSRDAERRRALAEKAGCEPAESLEAAIEAADAVVVATANQAHEAHAVAAAQRGRHVLVEKPIADTLEAGERIRDACERAGVALLVGHEFRRLGAARAAKRLVDAGALGRVVLAEANFSLAGKTPPGSWKEGERGRPLVQLGIHHADTLAYLLGPVARSTGTWTDDSGIAALELASGARAAIASSYVSPKTYALRLLGTEGVLEYRADVSVWPAADRLDELTTLTLNGEAVAFERVDPLVEELEELARCARGEAVPETGAAEGLAALKTILDAVDG